MQILINQLITINKERNNQFLKFQRVNQEIRLKKKGDGGDEEGMRSKDKK